MKKKIFEESRRPACAGQAKRLTGYGGVESEGLQAGELLAAGLLHAVAEDVLPGVQLQQLDAPQQLVGLLQTLAGVLLAARPGTESTRSLCSSSSSITL